MIHKSCYVCSVTWKNVSKCLLWCYKLLLWGLLFSSEMISFFPKCKETHDQFSFTKKNCSLSSLSTTSDFSGSFPTVAKELADSFTYSIGNDFSSKSIKVDVESQLSLSVWRSCSVIVQNSQHYSSGLATFLLWRIN